VRQHLLERTLLACGRLDGVTALLPDPDLFLYSYVRREAVLSSQIEGTQSSVSDLLLFDAEVLGQPLLYLSLYFKQHRDESYRLLDIVREITGSERERVFAYTRYLAVLNEGAGPCKELFVSTKSKTGMLLLGRPYARGFLCAYTNAAWRFKKRMEPGKRWTVAPFNVQITFATRTSLARTPDEAGLRVRTYRVVGTRVQNSPVAVNSPRWKTGGSLAPPCFTCKTRVFPSEPPGTRTWNL
jgi:Fic/DOC family N-terminal